MQAFLGADPPPSGVPGPRAPPGGAAPSSAHLALPRCLGPPLRPRRSPCSEDTGAPLRDRGASARQPRQRGRGLQGAVESRTWPPKWHCPPSLTRPKYAVCKLSSSSGVSCAGRGRGRHSRVKSPSHLQGFEKARPSAGGTSSLPRPRAPSPEHRRPPDLGAPGPLTR